MPEAEDQEIPQFTQTWCFERDQKSKNGRTVILPPDRHMNSSYYEA